MKKSFLPIQLFTFYDKQRFNSFNDIKSSFIDRDIKKDYFGYVIDCLKNYEKQQLFERLLIICPFIFFSNENKFSEANLKRHLDLDGTTVYDIDNLLNALNFRYDVKSILASIQSVKEISGAKFNNEPFVSLLFKYSYKLAFIKLAESIVWKTTEQGVPLKLNFRQFFELVSNAKWSMENNQSNFFASELDNDKLKTFDNSFGHEIKNKKMIVDEIELFLNNANCSKIFYSLIDFSVEMPKNMSSSKRNQLMRPFFYYIVCPLFYKDFMDYGKDHEFLVQKFRNFLRTYKNQIN